MTLHVMPGLASEVGRPRHQTLDVFLAPETVAVFGATPTPGSVGRALMANLIKYPFGGTVFPISPTRSGVLGIRAYARLADVPAAVDLALVATPALTVPAVLGECIANGVKGAIILSAGFGECGRSGAELERQIREQLRFGSLRVLGPNCLGVACPRTGINATFAPGMVRPGNVGFISQSGALLTALLYGGVQENVGCSIFLSVGSMIDIDWADCLEYLAEDPQTESIGIYLESIGGAPSFFAAARKVTPHKPVILVKGGRTAAAAKAAAAHTGSPLGHDEALEEAFRRTGVLRVQTIAELFRMAELLANQPRARGRRLAILTNAGGPGVLAADALIADGGELAPLAPATVATLDELLPAHGSRYNPIDIGDDATPERYAQAAAAVARDPNSDALLAILTPHSTIDAGQAAEQLTAVARRAGKPVLASWLWGAASPAAVTLLNQAGIPVFACPDTAVRAFGYLWRHHDNLCGLDETPTVSPEDLDGPTDRVLATRIVHAARRAGRTLLTEPEAARLLAAYSLPAVQARAAASEAEAVELAGTLGYPVVLRLVAEDNALGTEVGGVQLQAADAPAVHRAYRTLEQVARGHLGSSVAWSVQVLPLVPTGGHALLVGSTTDAQLGPVVYVGAGGPGAALSRGRAVALPPLSTALVRHLFEQPSLCHALRDAPGREPVDSEALAEFLARFSRLVVEQRWIREITINPLLSSAERLIALDTRVVLHGPEVQEDQLPKLALFPDLT